MTFKWKKEAAYQIRLAAFIFLLPILSGCSLFQSRPVKHLAYAEAAFQAAVLAEADKNPNSSSVFILAKNQLARARSFYRLKNFKEARIEAIKARLLAEEAEWMAISANSSSKDADSLVK